MLIGYFIVLAEPAVYVLTRQVEGIIKEQDETYCAVIDVDKQMV